MQIVYDITKPGQPNRTTCAPPDPTKWRMVSYKVMMVLKFEELKK